MIRCMAGTVVSLSRFWLRSMPRRSPSKSVPITVSVDRFPIWELTQRLYHLLDMHTSSSAANRQNFHPAVTAWFDATFSSPTEAQKQAWPLVRNSKTTLIAAPTGSGKTLTAFLAAVDALVCESSETGLPNETRVLYVSPLKALSNDICINLLNPLEGIDRIE